MKTTCLPHARPTLHRIVATLMVLAAATPLATAQARTPPSVHLKYPHDTGPVENQTEGAQVVISFPVRVSGAQWMRLDFAQVDLAGDTLAGDGSILRVTAALDGAVQEMNAIHLRQWRNTTAYFNGDTVIVEVLSWSRTGANRVVLDSVTAGLAPTQQESQCGATDDRLPSSDPAAARILPVGCTGWMIDDCNTCFLTAGHCDGGLGVVQFNVPPSTSGGGLVNPPPQDQYTIDSSSVQSNGGQGTGNDWAYFGAFPNTNTGLTPFQAQGARFTLTAPPPVAGNNIRITGYGTDSTPASRNQVQQTHVGPFVTNSGTLVQYQTDTEGGNSGSPVIWEEGGVAVGIHTHAGCSQAGGQNQGTSSTHPDLQNALSTPRGVCSAGATPVSLPPSCRSASPPRSTYRWEATWYPARSLCASVSTAACTSRRS